MKVLWFSNTPANADEYLSLEKNASGGWLKSLDQSIQNKVDLSVVFMHKKSLSPFIYKNTHYFPIKKSYKSILHKYLSLRFGIRKDYSDDYLRIVDEVKPDIIHIHGTENNYATIFSKTKIPVVLTMQGIITVIQHKYMAGFSDRYLHSGTPLLSRIIGLDGYAAAYRSLSVTLNNEKMAFLNAQYLIGRTAWDRRVCRVLSPQAKYFHVGEILREEFYNDQWNKARASKFVIYSTSSSDYYKGLETLCHAMIILQDTGVDDVELHIGGVSSKGVIVKTIMRLLEVCSLPNSINFLGRLDVDEIIGQMLSSDLYVSTSHIENSPNNIGEAMLLGMPCIASDVGGTSSLIVNNVEGVLIQDGDPWSLAGAILELKDDVEKSYRLGKSARCVAKTVYDKDKVCEDLLFVYKSSRIESD